MNPPNIIVILTDDLGYGDCSCYGQETWQTPNIDKLASEGMRFTDFYTTSPVCSPARASLLTGLHSGHLPIRNLDDPYLPDNIETIPKALKRAGYTSACIGKYGVGRGQPHADALEKGFDYHYGYNCMVHAHNYYPPFLHENGNKAMLRNKPPAHDPEQWETGVGVAEVKIDYSPDFIEDMALRFIETKKGTPFYLQYCPTLPHANNEGWVNGDPSKQTPDGMEVDTYGEFDKFDWSANEKGFARMVQRIDITVGRIVEKIKSLGIEDNTIIFFTSDNGPHDEGGHSVTRFNSSGGFQGYKRSLHEGGIRIPFIAWGPGNVKPGESDAMHYFPDLLDTLCDVSGAKVKGTNDGLSFLPTLTGQTTSIKEHPYLYFEYNGQIAVREKDWKYYRDAQGNEALYNLSKDKSESCNLKEVESSRLETLKAHVKKEHRDHIACSVPSN